MYLNIKMNDIFYLGGGGVVFVSTLKSYLRVDIIYFDHLL